MSLVEYIPLRNTTLLHRDKDMPVVGIKGFFIETERLIAIYEIWLNINDASSIVSASDNTITNVISLVPTEMEEPAIFEKDNEDNSKQTHFDILDL